MNPAQKQAIKIACQIAKTLKVKVGQKELDIARAINAQLKKYQAKPAFRAIIASGVRSAIPHGYATNKTIKTGEFVVIDFGALYKGYRSDITRTFIAGRPTKQQRQVYNLVKTAQKRAISAVKDGKICREIDLVAREYIKKKCVLYCHVSREKCRGDCFIHSTGHGIGRKVHQSPRISLKNRKRLKAGQIITVEPGLYIKGWGGVRIEDMVLVLKNGRKVLTI